jgi:hypothetical protein
MATDGLGLLHVKETYSSAAVVLRSRLRTAGLRGCSRAFAPIFLTLSQSQFLRQRRKIIIADMQLTMVSLAFLWLSVVGAI